MQWNRLKIHSWNKNKRSAKWMFFFVVEKNEKWTEFGQGVKSSVFNCINLAILKSLSCSFWWTVARRMEKKYFNRKVLSELNIIKSQWRIFGGTKYEAPNDLWIINAYRLQIQFSNSENHLILTFFARIVNKYIAKIPVQHHHANLGDMVS